MTSKTNPSTGQSRFLLKRLGAVTTILLLASTPSTFAGFIGPNAGSVAGITYAVENVNPAGGAVYNAATGQLVNIGGLTGGAGYGSLGAPVTPVSTFGGGVAAPAAALTPAGFGAFQPAVPGLNFGDTIGGSANLAATTFGGGSGAAVYWSNPTFIADNGVDGRASVNFCAGSRTSRTPRPTSKFPGLAWPLRELWAGKGRAAPSSRPRSTGGSASSTRAGHWSIASRLPWRSSPTDPALEAIL